MKKTIWVDIDGTLIPFDPTKTLEEVGRPGYSLKLPIIESIKQCIKRAYEAGYQVKILSAILNEYAKKDKIEITVSLPYGKEIVKGSRFVQYGESKTQFMEPGDILVDDFSPNLREWEAAGGIGIKVYNGINGTKGTWKGYSIHSTAEPENCVKQFMGILSMIDK